ncbi:MAG: sigma-54 dependent transcriptional regulator, partial [Bacteroidota bacterium]
MDTPLVYIVDDDFSLRRLLEFTLRTWGYASQTFSNGETLLKTLKEVPPAVVLMDHMMPGMSGLETLKAVREDKPDLPVIMLSAQGKIDVAVELMRAGATDYFTKPVDLKRLQFALNNAINLNMLQDKVRQLQDTLESTVRFENIISNSGVMQNVLKLVDKSRNSDINVLIEGESGTGKELIARAIHFNGARKDRPFVVINCAAIPRELLESELFGHERGSFTGAVDRKIGKFEAAHTGTIFLDEIGELDMTLQAKLLRVIQTKQFERIGALDTFTSDARIISATNRDLLSMAEQREFREDLYYRLCTFPIKLPPLRERPSEITLLAEHFLNQFSAREKKPGMTMHPDTIALLQRYNWPGNVRELQSIVERAVLLADG